MSATVVTPLRVLVVDPGAPAAGPIVRCVQALGHVAEGHASVAAAEASLRRGGWDVLVVDLDAFAPRATETLRALSAAAPPPLLGVSLAPDPFDLLDWAAAGLDRVVPPDCGDAWRVALDARLPRGFDPQPLARLQALDVQVFRESVQALLDDTPRKLDTIRAALERHDAPAARRAAHSLKGGAAQLGALRVAGLCASIEAQLAGDVFDTAAATAAQLVGVWRATEAWLADEVRA